MGFLSSFEGEETLDLSDLVGDPAGTWYVKIKKSLTNHELYLAKQHIARLIGGKAAPDMAAYHLDLVIASVVDWNLTDQHDRPLPLVPPDQKRNSVFNLPEKVFSQILSKAQELNSERSENDEKTFPVETPDSTTDGTGSTT